MATIDDLITEIERSYDELTAQLADPEVLGDRARYADAARAHAELQQVHELTQRYREAERTVADAEGLLGDDSSDAEMREFAQEELIEGRRRLEELSEEIRVRMLTRDPNDAKDVIIEIRAGTGGNEACIFAGELARMYTRYAAGQGLRGRDPLAPTRTTTAATRRSRSRSSGQGAYSMLKYEGGVHRVQRVPVDRGRGPHPHLHGHRGRAARGRGHRGRHPPERPAHRHLPRPRPGRAERQHHRLGRAHHPRADRRRR